MSRLPDFMASRNAGFVLPVSDLALIILETEDLATEDESFAADGISAICE